MPDRAGDLDEAITIHERAVAAARDDDPAYASMLVNHGGALLGRFDRDGAPADVTAAVDRYRRALDTAAGHLRPVALAQLGQALRARHGATGSIDDLHDAVAALRDAVAAVPDHDLERAWYCSFLGSALCARFRWHGEIVDIEESLRWHDRAREALPPGRPGRAQLLSSRAFGLRVRAERAGAERAGVGIEEAIDAAQEALDAEADAEHVPDLLAELGSTLALRTDRVQDITATIDVRRRVCALCPPDGPRRGLWLSDLAGSLRDRAQRTGDPADLAEAHALHEESVRLTGPGHPEYATVLSNLAGSFRDRFVRDGNRADLHAAFDRLRQVAELTTAPATRRLVAARTWGELAADTAEWTAARDGFTAAVDLLPTATWRGLDRASQEGLLRSSRWLAADAAAAALHLHDPAGALDLLERGRTVRWNQQLESVRTVDRLAEMAPDLAARLDAARAILDAPTAEPRAGSADSRIAAARDWETALVDVESRPDLAALLAGTPPDVPELPGTVIALTVSRHRCAAILLDRDGTRERELPALDLDALADQVRAYFDMLAVVVDPEATPDAHRAANAALTGVLHWLWEAVLADALDGVRPGERVWWCPTGPLTYLPLHAAGEVPDRVVSSYTPTLGSLLRALQPSSPPAPEQVLAVAVPAAVGQQPLPGALREIVEIVMQLPPDVEVTTLAGPAAGCDAVAAALRSCTWAHLACHGEQNPADPARAALVLTDGRLHATDITTRAAHHAEGAYLSACQTALGGVDLTDEVLHLAAALQFGGFRRVVATLWPVGDTAATGVTRQIYAALAAGGRFDPGRSAAAVRDVTLQLRDRRQDSPTRWAPFVHIGP